MIVWRRKACEERETISIKKRIESCYKALNGMKGRGKGYGIVNGCPSPGTDRNRGRM